MTKLKVAILVGGTSREAQVSRSSAAEVVTALESRHDALLIELDADVTAGLAAFRPDVVFPVLHGPPGEDGTVQGYLEILGLPYVGSGVHASAVGMDKGVAKDLFRRVELPVCAELVIDADAAPAPAAQRIQAVLGERVVIKPTRLGSAIGVTPVANGGDLCAPLEAALSLGGDVLVEPYILGREVTVGVFHPEGSAATTFPPIEIRTPSGTWYDYQHRYTPGRSEHLIPAPLPNATLADLRRIAVDAHRVLECVDLSRADFIVTDNDEIFLLEVNTLPGLTPTSLYPEGAAAVGMPFDELVDALVRSAMRRGPR
jgi:D-alanine-D-alanine ligase